MAMTQRPSPVWILGLVIVSIVTGLALLFSLTKAGTFEEERRQPTVTEVALADGTRCAVLWGSPYGNAAAIACDWRH